MNKKTKWALAMAGAAVLGTGAVALAHPPGGGFGGGGFGGPFMEQFDANDDGQLDQSERDAMRAARQARRAQVIAQFDKNGDGQLDDQEREAARSAHAEQRFQALDTDKNGVLSLEEFKAGMGKGFMGPGRRGR